MSSAYPDGYDVFTDHVNADASTREVIRAEHINVLADAIEAIQAELGLTPKGEAPTVAARLEGIGFYRYTQPIPASTWTITHTLSGYPNVTVVDSAGSVVVGEVRYTSPVEIVIDFSSPFAGAAYLS